MSQCLFNQLVSSKFKLGFECKQNVLKRDLKDTICADRRIVQFHGIHTEIHELRSVYFKGKTSIVEKEQALFQ